MYWTAHVARLQTALRESAVGDVSGPQPTDPVIDEVLDVVTDLVALLLPHEDTTVRNVGVAAMHLSFAREDVMPYGPSPVPGNLPLPIAFRDARALLSAALDAMGPRDRCVEASALTVIARSRTRNHLRAAARALGRDVVLPAQRGPRGARTV